MVSRWMVASPLEAMAQSAQIGHKRIAAASPPFVDRAGHLHSLFSIIPPVDGHFSLQAGQFSQ
jgi:hypothetical protein